MKKAIFLIVALAVLCMAVCACSDGGNVSDNKGGVVTDNGGNSNIVDDIKDGADDVGDDIKDNVNDMMTPDPSPAAPQQTAIPGTQVITP